MFRDPVYEQLDLRRRVFGLLIVPSWHVKHVVQLGCKLNAISRIAQVKIYEFVINLQHLSRCAHLYTKHNVPHCHVAVGTENTEILCHHSKQRWQRE